MGKDKRTWFEKKVEYKERCRCRGGGEEQVKKTGNKKGRAEERFRDEVRKGRRKRIVKEEKPSGETCRGEKGRL